MVEAFIFARYGPASRSAAFRKTAARSCQGSAAQAGRAFSAASIARWASFAPAMWNFAITVECSCGITTSPVLPVRTLRPLMMQGMSIAFALCFFSSALTAAFSALPGA